MNGYPGLKGISGYFCESCEKICSTLTSAKRHNKHKEQVKKIYYINLLINGASRMVLVNNPNAVNADLEMREEVCSFFLLLFSSFCICFFEFYLFFFYIMIVLL